MTARLSTGTRVRIATNDLLEYSGRVGRIVGHHDTFDWYRVRIWLATSGTPRLAWYMPADVSPLGAAQ